MGFLNIICLKRVYISKAKYQMVVYVNGCASFCTSMFYIRESHGHAKIRNTF